MTEKLTTSSAYTASGICAAFGSITANELAAYGGLFIAILTFATNAYFQWRRDKREAEALKLKQ